MSLRTLPLPPEPRHHRSHRRARFLRRMFRKPVLQAMLLCFCLYSLIYVFLSAGGRWQVARDRVIWNPYGLRFDYRRNENDRLVVRGSFFGYLYSPLVFVDRFVFHRPFAADSERGRIIEQQERETKVHEWQLEKK